MKRYQFKVYEPTYLRDGAVDIERDINQLGAEGWCVVASTATLSGANDYRFRVVLQREIPNDTPYR